MPRTKGSKNYPQGLKEKIIKGYNLELFNEYAMCCTELSCLSSADAFISGFKLGARIIHDAFID